MKHIIATILFLAAFTTSTAQNINDYKYVLVPNTYEFLGEENEYQLNALTKFLFEKAGFNSKMINAPRPEDLLENNCLGLKAKVSKNSGLFVTKLILELEDCYGDVVFTSKEGRSREKDYKKAYHEALRDAFSSLENMDYEYKPLKTTAQPAQVVVAGIEPVGRLDDKPMRKEEDTLKKSNASKSSTINDNRSYQLTNKEYTLKSNSQGFGLFEKDAVEPFAVLIKSGGGEQFIYNSLTNQGIAYFDNSRNLIVEYFNQQTQQKTVLKYEVRN